MLKEALGLHRNDKSQRYVKEKCGITRQTLGNHIKTGSSKRILGGKLTLLKQQEDDLERKIIRFADMGCPLTPKSIRRGVFKFAEQQNVTQSREKVYCGRLF